MSNQITYISIDRIFPHPKNPRMELGDISELAESIKVNGVLQNLTVVPHQSVANQAEGFYTVIIGHRRLAAAELAGLDSIPCVVTEMDECEQVATMLLENIQRSDLTIYEQAKGFQMMFDLGESTKSISERTGLSENTIRSRANLLKLDEKKLKDATNRGATLQDLAELNAIGDVELRNRVLDSVGTSNFRSMLTRAKDTELTAKNKPWIIEQLERFAVKTKECYGKVFVASYYIKEFTDSIKIPDDAGHVNYYWYESGSYIYLYKDKIKTLDEIKKDEKADQLRRSRDVLEDISKRALKLRFDFISNYPGRKRDMQILTEAAAMLLCDSTEGVGIAPNDDLLIKLLGADSDDDKTLAQQSKEYFGVMPEYTFACLIYSALEIESARYYDSELNYKYSEALDNVYEFLIKLGYELSDEELSLKNGTHILLKGA